MRIVFMGTPPAAVRSLAALLDDGHDIAAVYTQPDRPSGRGNKITFPPVKEFALERGLPVMQPTKIRTPEAIDEFRSFLADVAVVVAYGRILPETYLTAFPHGAINVHFSLLPKYRGAAPVNWAIVNRETVTGVTSMQMDAGLDTGKILLQRSTTIGEQETSIELMSRLADIGAEVLIDTLRQIDTLVPTPQDDRLATLAPIMRKSDGLIDWAMPAGDIASRVRGFQPFPGTFTSLGGLKLTVRRAEELEGFAGRPGEVLAASGDSLIIGCGKNTALAIRELQLEGKRPVAARDFLNGSKLSVGDSLE